jgi:hypothetical protein
VIASQLEPSASPGLAYVYGLCRVASFRVSTSLNLYAQEHPTIARSISVPIRMLRSASDDAPLCPHPVV